MQDHEYKPPLKTTPHEPVLGDFSALKSFPARKLFAFKQRWVDEVITVTQAKSIIKRASIYGFIYWLWDCSFILTYSKKLHHFLKTVTPAEITATESLKLLIASPIASPLFELYALLAEGTALMCFVILAYCASSNAAIVLLALWGLLAWLKVATFEPDFFHTPLFLFMVWTTCRALMATKIIKQQTNS